MSEKIIIDNRTNKSLADSSILELVRMVIKQGRISGDGYCYATRFEALESDYFVYATKNKASDTFVITNNGE